MFNLLALLSRMAALRSLAMDHADVAAPVLPVVLIVANGKPIRMAKEAEAKVVSTSLVIARASAALSANLLMVSVVDVAAAADVVAAVATIVVVVAALVVVAVVAEIAVDAVVSVVVVADAAAAAVVALATDHSTRRQSKIRKLLSTTEK